MAAVVVAALVVAAVVVAAAESEEGKVAAAAGSTTCTGCLAAFASRVVSNKPTPEAPSNGVPSTASSHCYHTTANFHCYHTTARFHCYQVTVVISELMGAAPPTSESTSGKTSTAIGLHGFCQLLVASSERHGAGHGETLFPLKRMPAVIATLRREPP